MFSSCRMPENFTGKARRKIYGELVNLVFDWEKKAMPSRAKPLSYVRMQEIKAKQSLYYTYRHVSFAHVGAERQINMHTSIHTVFQKTISRNQACPQPAVCTLV